MSIRLGDKEVELYIGDQPISASELPQYVQDGLYFYTDKNIGKVGSHARIGAGINYTNGYTIEAACKLTGAASSNFGRIIEWSSDTSGISTLADCIAIDTRNTPAELECLICGSWYDTKDKLDVPVVYGSLVTYTLTVSPNNIAKVYVNGELAATITNAPSISSSKNDGGYYYLGCGSTSNRLINGTVYSGRYYNKVLSAAEIAANHAADVARFRE